MTVFYLLKFSDYWAILNLFLIKISYLYLIGELPSWIILLVFSFLTAASSFFSVFWVKLESSSQKDPQLDTGVVSLDWTFDVTPEVSCITFRGLCMENADSSRPNMPGIGDFISFTNPKGLITALPTLPFGVLELLYSLNLLFVNRPVGPFNVVIYFLMLFKSYSKPLMGLLPGLWDSVCLFWECSPFLIL